MHEPIANAPAARMPARMKEIGKLLRRALTRVW
jgi:hypothetical protein